MISHTAEDARLEQTIRQILRIGVTVSSVFLGIGLVWSLAEPGSSTAALLMTIGLMILMATPAARVAASVLEYAAERDWLFVGLTSLVLIEIIAGVVAALAFHRRL